MAAWQLANTAKFLDSLKINDKWKKCLAKHELRKMY